MWSRAQTTHLFALGHPGIALDPVRALISQMQPYIQEAQPDAGHQDGRHGHEGDGLPGALQAAFNAARSFLQKSRSIRFRRSD